MLVTPVELRERSKIYLAAATAASRVEAKRQLAAYALTLAQVAECIERDTASVRVDDLRRALTEAQMALRIAPSELRAIAGAITQQAISQDRDRIKRWRQRAEELRTVADQFVVPSVQETLRRTAANYEQLADDAEAQLSGTPPTSSDEAGQGDAMQSQLIS